MKAKILLFIFLNLLGHVLFAQKKALNDYDINWTSPGLNSQGSMPIGNGDIGANVWVEDNGDLVFYISKTDAWSEVGRILKLGRVRVSIQPSSIKKNGFLQTLKLQYGEMKINLGDTQINFWVDANNPVIEMDIKSPNATKVKVQYENWHKERRLIAGSEGFSVSGFGESLGEVFQEPDIVVSNNSDKIVSYHHNNYSIWKRNLSIQSLENTLQNNSDPLLGLTYGLLIQGNGLKNVNDTILVSSRERKQHRIEIFPFTKKINPVIWQNELVKRAHFIESLSYQKRLTAHRKWWVDFWNRSYIFITANDEKNREDAEKVTQGYILQRFINACAGRGNFPIKFNGSIFTVDTYNRKGERPNMDADYRSWGGSYWWQNTRLIYWSMLLSGDLDLMKPFFKMYFDVLPIRKEATRKYYQHEGAFYPETMDFWGTYNIGDYGSNRAGLKEGFTINPYVRYYWSGGLELSLMMLDYYSFTKDAEFLKKMVPFVSEILTFYDQHWKRGVDGKIKFDPAMSLETYHTAINPLPEIVGIRTVAQKMMNLPQSHISALDREKWSKLIADLPALPIHIVKEDTLLAPAHEFSNKANAESPELYAVFPYRAYGLKRPNLALAKRTFRARNHKENGGWQQSSIQATLLGLTEEAKNMIIQSYSSWDKNFRFPAFWGPNYDWTPDQCHGNVAAIALQRMIIQYEDANVDLFPSWPKEWNVRFKFMGPNKHIYEGEYKKGVLKLKSNP